jgi:hypothetical protein
MRVEHEYRRGGAWAYLAALDVHRAKVFGRCEPTTGIAPFDRLVAQVMTQSPYREARRVFWTMDNGSSHRGDASVRRLQTTFPTLVPVHGPIHASWLNQIEIYFSILQRKALTPHDFESMADVEDRLLGFERYYESIAARAALRAECPSRWPRVCCRFQPGGESREARRAHRPSTPGGSLHSSQGSSPAAAAALTGRQARARPCRPRAAGRGRAARQRSCRATTRGRTAAAR